MKKRPINKSKRDQRAKPERQRSELRKKNSSTRSKRLANSNDVELVQGLTKKIVGGHRLFWWVRYRGQSAGRVSIDCIAIKGGVDTSIDVQLNLQSRGKGIGTIAFRRACELSGLKEVLASIRKGNIASQVAATKAGFVLLEQQRSGELLMIWRKG